MKVIRSYRLSRDVLYCDVFFLPSDAEYIDDEHWTASGPEFRQLTLSAIVGPSSSRLDDLKVQSSNCSRSVIIDETILFCQTIKQMYQL